MQPREAVPGEQVHRLAHLALRALTTQDVVRSEDLDRRVKVLCAAFLSTSERPRFRSIQRLREDGVPVSEIIDTIIPDVARCLGQRWADDSLSFAEVTIGTARLQEAVRSLSGHELGWTVRSLDLLTRGEEIARTPRVLLIIPRPEDHTLGTFVAADQLRRFGYDVDVSVDQRPSDIAATLNRRRYSMVGISVAGRRALAATRELVDVIRASVTRVTPIVLGGSLLAFDSDLKQATGVDHVAPSPRDALVLCGLAIAVADPPARMVTSHAQ